MFTFKFNQTYYNKFNASPMLSPLNLFAEIDIRDLENYCLSYLKFQPL